ncbi:MAG: hypothetical protein ACREOE_06350 [Gemmatimonadales bacterium]
MRHGSVLFLASLALGAAVAAVACGSSNSTGSSDDGGPDSAGSSSSGGTASSSGGSSSGVAGSSGSSSGGAEAGVLPMGMQIGTVPTPMDGGVYCPAAFGAMAACAAPQVCCWGDQSQMPPPMAGCTASSACTGSVVACSGTAQCPAGQVCCFAFTGDAGATGAGPSGPFGAQCATSCPEGDMVHYRLCSSSADCTSGEICNNMAPYSPYCIATGPVDGGGDGAPGSQADASDGGSPSDAGAPSDASDGSAE